MSTIGKPLGAKLFLEGKEVPFIGATITSTVGQASIAYIDMVPHQTINNILPRTMVHLFVRDITDAENNYPYVEAFEGEVFGMSFGKTPSSRTFSISCIDYSSYWDNVLSYFFNPQQSLAKGAEFIQSIGLELADAEKQGFVKQAVTHSEASYFYLVFKEVLGQPGKDFLDGFVELYRRISKVNDFYNLAEDRLKIIDRIKLHSSSALTELLNKQQALDWFNELFGSGKSGYSTLRSVIQDLMGIIFHDFTSPSFPGLVKDSPAQFVFKPNLYMMPPPMCNVFFPEEYSNFTYQRNFFQEPTRLIYKPEMPVFGGGSVALSHAYQPESFRHFMIKEGPIPDELKGDSDLAVDTDYGHFGDETPGAEIFASKKEQFFLTNEEKMRGILMAQETIVPGNNAFRAALDDIGKVKFADNVAKYLFFKKRFQTRDVQITGHLKTSVVPGFPVLLLDDSDAEQNIIAYCSSVTHRVYATQGGYTNTTLSYSRTLEEQDSATGTAHEPLIPPWFSKELFGGLTAEELAAKANKSSQIALNKMLPAEDQFESTETYVSNVADSKFRAMASSLNATKVSDFYASLIGLDGSKNINDLMKEASLVGATKKLIEQYRAQRKKSPDAIDAFISKLTKRDYIDMKTAFKILGAETTTKDLINTQFIEFFGDRIKGTGKGDEKQIARRRAVIDDYRSALKTKRGFRG